MRAYSGSFYKARCRSARLLLACLTGRAGLSSGETLRAILPARGILRGDAHAIQRPRTSVVATQFRRNRLQALTRTSARERIGARPGERFSVVGRHQGRCGVAAGGRQTRAAEACAQ
jgi:hypothetical protein